MPWLWLPQVCPYLPSPLLQQNPEIACYQVHATKYMLPSTYYQVRMPASIDSQQAPASPPQNIQVIYMCILFQIRGSSLARRLVLERARPGQSRGAARRRRPTSSFTGPPIRGGDRG